MHPLLQAAQQCKTNKVWPFLGHLRRLHHWRVLEKATDMVVTVIKAPIGSIYQKYVYTCFMVMMINSNHHIWQFLVHSVLLKAPWHKFPYLESPNQPQGLAIRSEIIVVIIPIDSNHDIWHFPENLMLLKALWHKFPYLESPNQPQGPAIGLEVVLVIIPIDSNHHIWQFLVNSMLLKAP